MAKRVFYSMMPADGAARYGADNPTITKDAINEVFQVIGGFALLYDTVESMNAEKADTETGTVMVRVTIEDYDDPASSN